MSILNVNQIQPVGGGNTITVSASDVNFSGNISIGSSFVGTASTATLATISQGLTGTPDITVNNIQSGIVTATTFIGNGSGITGVTASGSGINIKDSGSTVGVAATVDFSTNLNVSPASAGIVTVTVGDTDFEIADKIIHTGDTNTAIRFPAADTFTVETGGTERLRIDSSGNITLGYAGNSLYFQNGFNNSAARIQNGGGSNSSNLKFLVKNAGTEAEALRISSDGQSTFDKGAPGSANQVIARFQAESTRRLDIVWHDSGSLLGFDLPGSHSYIFKCSGSEKLRINSAGNLGIGIDPNFPIYTGTNDRTLILGTGSEDSAIQIHSSGTGYGGVYFGDSTSGNARYNGYVEFKHGTSDDFLRFGTGSTERLRITSAGNLSITDGNLVVASGHGIDFSATADGSGTDTSELLDDYEEGTWTPTTTNFTHTTDATECRYTKIGRMVYLTGQISRSQASSPTTAILVITGLPYAQSSVTRSIQGTFWLDNLSQSDDYIGGISYANNATQIIFTQSSSPTHTHSTRYIQGNYFDNGRGMLFSVTYITD